MPKSPRVTEKNTKQEILDAYRQILAEASREAGVLDSDRQEEEAVLSEASKETIAKITTDVSQLKVSLNQSISDLSDRLTEEAEKLGTLQKAIRIAERELEEVQQVKVRAGMLHKMIELQRQKEEEFEKEMTQKRNVWNDEQKEHEEHVKRERVREAEEYAYSQKLAQARDNDEREAAKRVFERELTEKKDLLVRDAKELEELRKRVSDFPTETERAAKEAVAKAVSEAKREAETAAQITKQKADGELALANQRIASLAETLKSQTAEIARLNRELAEATHQVKEIAVSLVEGGRKEPVSPQASKAGS